MKTLHFKPISRILVPALLMTLPAVCQEKLKERRPPKREAEFTLRLIEASTGTGPNDAAALVPAELKAILKYDRYGLLDSAFVRGVEDESLSILVAAGTMKSEIQFEVDAQTSTLTVEVEIVQRGTTNAGNSTLLETESRVKSGETVVLGASRMRGGGNSLIVLLTAKLLP
jgi:hypothetical protein